MGTIRKNSSLKRRTLRKKGGSDNKKLELGIKDERGNEIYVPIQRDNQGNLYAEDKSAIDPHTGKKLDDAAQLRTDRGAPEYHPNWRNFDEKAIKFYENNHKKGGKRKKTKRKYRKGKKTRKVKKSRKRARK
jgi:hypothetical protein